MSQFKHSYTICVVSVNCNILCVYTIHRKVSKGSIQKSHQVIRTTISSYNETHHISVLIQYNSYYYLDTLVPFKK